MAIMIQITSWGKEVMWISAVNDNRLNIHLAAYKYNHWKWLERECLRINSDTLRKAVIRTNKKGEKALFVDQPRGMDLL